MLLENVSSTPLFFLSFSITEQLTTLFSFLSSSVAYARSVVPEPAQPQQFAPNRTIWDTLMKRDKFVHHPSGISQVSILSSPSHLPLHSLLVFLCRSLLFAFATCITHSCFNTNRNDTNINDASSSLDLSPLYVSSLSLFRKSLLELKLK